MARPSSSFPLSLPLGLGGIEGHLERINASSAEYFDFHPTPSISCLFSISFRPCLRHSKCTRRAKKNTDSTAFFTSARFFIPQLRALKLEDGVFQPYVSTRKINRLFLKSDSDRILRLAKPNRLGTGDGSPNPFLSKYTHLCDTCGQHDHLSRQDRRTMPGSASGPSASSRR